MIAYLGYRRDARMRERDQAARRKQLATTLAGNVERNLKLLTGGAIKQEVQQGLLPTMEENIRLARENRAAGTPIPPSYIYFGYFNTALLDATAVLKYDLGLGSGLSARLDEFHDGLANLNRLLLLRLQREYVMQRDQIERTDQDTMIDYEIRRVATEAVGIANESRLLTELRAVGESG